MKNRLPIIVAGLTLVTAGFALDLGGFADGLSKFKQGIDKGKEIKETAEDVQKVIKAAAGIGPEEEARIGQSVALEVIGRFGGLVRDDEMSRRVNLIGRSLARYSDRPELEWRFGILNSKTVNAISCPGGYVFITLALYKQASSDDELAGILGHEITHVTGKHALHIIRRTEFFSGADSLGSKYSSDYRQGKSAVSDVSATLQEFDLGIGNIVKGLVETGYDHKTEFAADAGGRELAHTTGYAPGGLRAVLQQLKGHGGDEKKIFSTHPPLKERIQRLPDEPAA